MDGGKQVGGVKLFSHIILKEGRGFLYSTEEHFENALNFVLSYTYCCLVEQDTCFGLRLRMRRVQLKPKFNQLKPT